MACSHSLNNAIVVCLEAGLGADASPVEVQLAQIRALCESLGSQGFDPDEIDAFKREGRL